MKTERMKQFNPTKNKETYSNGISHSKKEPTQTKSYEEWPILTTTGDLIGFIKLEKNTDLPPEVWLKDRKYKKSEKITKN